jgi:hypothetical protein
MRLNAQGSAMWLERLRWVQHRAAMRSEWDVPFVRDMIERLSEKAAPSALSRKQRAQLERIWSRYDEAAEADEVINQFPYADYGGRSPYQR